MNQLRELLQNPGLGNTASLLIFVIPLVIYALALREERQQGTSAEKEVATPVDAPEHSSWLPGDGRRRLPLLAGATLLLALYTLLLYITPIPWDKGFWLLFGTFETLLFAFLTFKASTATRTG